MNKPSKLVLTEAHVKVLEALREAQPMGITQLSKFPGLSRRSALSDVCADLLEHGLLVADKQPSPPGGGSPIRAYSLSMAGCRALAAHKRLQDAARMMLPTPGIATSATATSSTPSRATRVQLLPSA